MKKILIIFGIGMGMFLVLVVVLFIILSKLQPAEPPPMAERPEDPNRRSVTSLLLEQRESEVDSLKTQVTDLKNENFAQSVAIDSINEVVVFKDNLITEYEKEINELNDRLLDKQKRQNNIKELAKTFETMKVADISPILNKVDNETVIAIYKHMGSRSRKMIMMALNDNRAAEITRKLAGSQQE